MPHSLRHHRVLALGHSCGGPHDIKMYDLILLRQSSKLFHICFNELKQQYATEILSSTDEIKEIIVFG